MAMHQTVPVPGHVPGRVSGAAPHRAGDRLHGRSRPILYGLGAVLLLLRAWYLVSHLLAPKHKAPPPPPVKVAIVQRRDMTVTQKTIGTVVSPATVQVTAQVTGKLLAANFHEGDIVHKGELLFQIDPAPYQAMEAEAEGQLARDTANLANDRLDLERYQTLARQNAISNQQLATQAAKVKADEGVLETDKAAVQSARINLNFTRIVSPIDGKTGPILIQPGNVIPAVSATTQPLVSITQIQPIKLSLMLPQNGLAQIQNQFNQHRLMAVVPIAGTPGDAETAPINFVSNAVSASTGTIELRAEFPNADMRLVPGQTVTVAVTINQIPGAILVPRDAVNLGPENAFVLVVAKDGKAYSRTVKFLSDDGVNHAIAGADKPRDRVVTNGQLRVTPGQPVRIVGDRSGGKAGRR